MGPVCGSATKLRSVLGQEAKVPFISYANAKGGSASDVQK